MAARPRAASSIRAQVSPVYVGLTIEHVFQVSTRNQSYNAEIKVIAKWKCPEEHAAEAMREGSDALDVDWEPEWMPRVSVLFTTEEMHLQSREFRAMHGSEEDRTVYIEGIWNLTVAVAETYDLKDFPFDVQDLNLSLRLDNIDRIELLEDDGEAVCVEGQGISLPDMRSLDMLPAMYRRAPNAPNELHAVLLYERVLDYYLYNYLLLLGLFTSSALATWAVPWMDIADRLGLDMTLLLTSVAFKQVLAEALPPVQYLTMLDRYALASLCFLALAGAMHTTHGFMISDCDADGECIFHGHLTLTPTGAAMLDQFCLGVWSVLWLAFNGWFFCAARTKKQFDRTRYSTANTAAFGFKPARLVAPAPWWEQQASEARAESRKKKDLTQSGVQLASPKSGRKSVGEGGPVV